MSLEPRIVELSRDNFDAAIETFLRTMDKIKDSETPESFRYVFDVSDLVKVTIHFKPQEENKTVDHTVH